LSAAAKQVNVFQSGTAGEHIRVAVIDSVLGLPSDWDTIVDSTNNYVASGARDTTGHGTTVMQFLDVFAPEAVYNLYRVVAEDEEFRVSNFLKAMADIRDRDTDVVNVSAGKYHADCGGRCRICEAVEAVIGDGTIVVAGAGHREPDRGLGVYCPARSTESIAVGMSETICTASPDSTNLLSEAAELYRAPGSYWATEAVDNPSYPSDTYCGGVRCSPRNSCDENKVETYWYGNCEWEAYVPQVVAPGHWPLQSEDGDECGLEPGTSYSTAIVSGAIATVLSEIYPPIPTPQRVSRTVESTSQNMECGVVGKLDMTRLYDALQ